MKIVVLGAGGVGGYFGGRLAAAGNDVTFVARGAHLASMRKNGLENYKPARGPRHSSRSKRWRLSQKRAPPTWC